MNAAAGLCELSAGRDKEDPAEETVFANGAKKRSQASADAGQKLVFGLRPLVLGLGSWILAAAIGATTESKS
jgi:hypothetical protein